jgi:hypothetical protein
MLQVHFESAFNLPPQLNSAFHELKQFAVKKIGFDSFCQAMAKQLGAKKSSTVQDGRIKRTADD